MADNEQMWKPFTTSAGIDLLYGPFPGALYWDIMARALELFPDPDPPMKTIEVVDGTEQVEDLDDQEYKTKLAQAQLERHGFMGEAMLEMCIKIVTPDWEKIAERIADKWLKDPLPDNTEDRKVWFLGKYALRTPKDWEIYSKIRRFSQIEDDEVRQRTEFFRGDVAGDEGTGPNAPRPAEE